MSKSSEIINDSLEILIENGWDSLVEEIICGGYFVTLMTSRSNKQYVMVDFTTTQPLSEKGFEQRSYDLYDLFIKQKKWYRA